MRRTRSHDTTEEDLLSLPEYAYLLDVLTKKPRKRQALDIPPPLPPRDEHPKEVNINIDLGDEDDDDENPPPLPPRWDNPLQELLAKVARKAAVNVNESDPTFKAGVDARRREIARDRPVYNSNPFDLSYKDRNVTPSIKLATSLADAMKSSSVFKRIRENLGEATPEVPTARPTRPVGRLSGDYSTLAALFGKKKRGGWQVRSQKGSAAMRARMAYVRSFRRRK